MSPTKGIPGVKDFNSEEADHLMCHEGFVLVGVESELYMPLRLSGTLYFLVFNG